MVLLETSVRYSVGGPKGDPVAVFASRRYVVRAFAAAHVFCLVAAAMASSHHVAGCCDNGAAAQFVVAIVSPAASAIPRTKPCNKTSSSCIPS